MRLLHSRPAGLALFLTALIPIAGCSIDPDRTLSLRLIDAATGKAVEGAVVEKSTSILAPHRQPDRIVGQSDPNGLFRIRMGTWDALTIRKPGYAETHVGWMWHSYIAVGEARPDLPLSGSEGTDSFPTRRRVAFPYIGPYEIWLGLEPILSAGTTTRPASMPAE